MPGDDEDDLVRDRHGRLLPALAAHHLPEVRAQVGVLHRRRDPSGRQRIAAEPAAARGGASAGPQGALVDKGCDQGWARDAYMVTVTPSRRIAAPIRS